MMYHFTGWPDRGVPKDTLSIFSFLNRVRLDRLPTSGPAVVHCSAGVGRTGVFLLCDIATDALSDTGFVDIPNILTKLRGQRHLLVQVPVQYRFCYEVMITMADLIMAANTGNQAGMRDTKLTPSVVADPLLLHTAVVVPDRQFIPPSVITAQNTPLPQTRQGVPNMPIVPSSPQANISQEDLEAAEYILTASNQINDTVMELAVNVQPPQAYAILADICDNYRSHLDKHKNKMDKLMLANPNVFTQQAMKFTINRQKVDTKALDVRDMFRNYRAHIISKVAEHASRLAEAMKDLTSDQKCASARSLLETALTYASEIESGFTENIRPFTSDIGVKKTFQDENVWVNQQIGIFRLNKEDVRLQPPLIDTPQHSATALEKPPQLNMLFPTTDESKFAGRSTLGEAMLTFKFSSMDSFDLLGGASRMSNSRYDASAAVAHQFAKFRSIICKVASRHTMLTDEENTQLRQCIAALKKQYEILDTLDKELTLGFSFDETIKSSTLDRAELQRAKAAFNEYRPCLIAYVSSEEGRYATEIQNALITLAEDVAKQFYAIQALPKDDALLPISARVQAATEETNAVSAVSTQQAVLKSLHDYCQSVTHGTVNLIRMNTRITLAVGFNIKNDNHRLDGIIDPLRATWSQDCVKLRALFEQFRAAETAMGATTVYSRENVAFIRRCSDDINALYDSTYASSVLLLDNDPKSNTLYRDCINEFQSQYNEITAFMTNLGPPNAPSSTVQPLLEWQSRNTSNGAALKPNWDGVSHSSDIDAQSRKSHLATVASLNSETFKYDFMLKVTITRYHIKNLISLDNLQYTKSMIKSYNEFQSNFANYSTKLEPILRDLGVHVVNIPPVNGIVDSATLTAYFNENDAKIAALTNMYTQLQTCAEQIPTTIGNNDAMDKAHYALWVAAEKEFTSYTTMTDNLYSVFVDQITRVAAMSSLQEEYIKTCSTPSKLQNIPRARDFVLSYLETKLVDSTTTNKYQFDMYVFTLQNMHFQISELFIAAELSLRVDKPLEAGRLDALYAAIDKIQPPIIQSQFTIDCASDLNEWKEWIAYAKIFIRRYGDTSPQVLVLSASHAKLQWFEILKDRFKIFASTTFTDKVTIMQLYIERTAKDHRNGINALMAVATSALDDTARAAGCPIIHAFSKHTNYKASLALLQILNNELLVFTTKIPNQRLTQYRGDRNFTPSDIMLWVEYLQSRIAHYTEYKQLGLKKLENGIKNTLLSGQTSQATCFYLLYSLDTAPDLNLYLAAYIVRCLVISDPDKIINGEVVSLPTKCGQTFIRQFGYLWPAMSLKDEYKYSELFTAISQCSPQIYHILLRTATSYNTEMGAFDDHLLNMKILSTDVTADNEEELIWMLYKEAHAISINMVNITDAFDRVVGQLTLILDVLTAIVSTVFTHTPGAKDDDQIFRCVNASQLEYIFIDNNLVTKIIDRITSIKEALCGVAPKIGIFGKTTQTLENSFRSFVTDSTWRSALYRQLEPSKEALREDDQQAILNRILVQIRAVDAIDQLCIMCNDAIPAPETTSVTAQYIRRSKTQQKKSFSSDRTRVPPNSFFSYKEYKDMHTHADSCEPWSGDVSKRLKVLIERDDVILSIPEMLDALISVGPDNRSYVSYSMAIRITQTSTHVKDRVFAELMQPSGRIQCVVNIVCLAYGTKTPPAVDEARFCTSMAFIMAYGMYDPGESSPLRQYVVNTVNANSLFITAVEDKIIALITNPPKDIRQGENRHIILQHIGRIAHFFYKLVNRNKDFTKGYYTEKNFIEEAIAGPGPNHYVRVLTKLSEAYNTS